MSYDPVTDFLGLSRLASDGLHFERMPGLDYVVAALARMGLIRVSVGQTAPVANQTTTAWLRPSSPSWVAEGAFFLWDASVNDYRTATPELWIELFSASGYSFYSATAANSAIPAGTTLAAVQRVSPTATGLTLPQVTAQWATGRPLKIVDWSTGVTGHFITLTAAGGNTIMQLPSFQLMSTGVQLTGVTLHASPELNGWVIAP